MNKPLLLCTLIALALATAGCATHHAAYAKTKREVKDTPSGEPSRSPDTQRANNPNDNQ